MKEGYWDQFMITGKVADYLRYKSEKCAGEGEESRSSSGRKEQCEPDRIDRNGALHGTGGRI